MKKNMLGWGVRVAAFALPVTLVTACGDSGLDLDAPASASQANISNLTASFNDTLINEGSGTAARITRLCVDSNTNTTIAVNWGDGTNDLVTKTGGGFLQNTASCPGVGIFEVCGNATACADIPHTYADDSADAPQLTFAASITVTNAGGDNTFTQPGGITVRNLPPTIVNLTQDTAANTEEGLEQIFSAVINDPGTAGSEIVNVVFTITPPPTRAPGTASNAQPDVITCTCVNDVLTCPGDLDTGSCHGGTARVRSRFLDNGNYSVAAVITDEDNLTATANLGPITIDNKSPVQPDIRITGSVINPNGTPGTLTSASVSASSANPTRVLEGFNYAAAFVLEDQGTDQLTWNWSFANGRATGAGAGSISNLTRPFLDSATVTPSVALALNDEVRWNDIVADRQLDFEVADDDGNSNNAPHFVFVRDANPIISAFTGGASVNEGSTVTYNVTTTSGDFGSGLDPLSRREWIVASGSNAACEAERVRTSALNASYDPATGSCFLGFQINRTWDSARLDCLSRGLQLASIHSLSDFNRAQSLIPNGWNALNDIAQEGNFVNVDGSAFDFPFFGGGEPNNSGDEDCVQGSNDLNCNSGLNYVCATNVGDDLSNGVAANSPYAIDAGCGIADDSCTIRFLDDTTDSPHGISVRVRDEDSFTTSPGIRTTVNNVNPVFTAITMNGATFGPGLAINEAGTMAFEVEAFDPAVALDGTYTLTINYGTSPGQVDVTTLTALGTGARFASQSEIVIDNDRCIPSPNTVGGCVVTLTVCEVGDVNCATTSQTVTVNNVAPVVVALEPTAEALVEGVAFDLDGEFTDVAGSDDDNYSATWSWSDGSVARQENRSVPFVNRLAGPDIRPTSQVFENVPAAGLNAVAFRLTVTDEDGGATTGAPITSNVRDNVPNVDITDLDFVGGDNDELATPIITLDVEPETSSDLLTRVVIAWGDGTTSILTAVSGQPGANQFSEGGEKGLVVQKPAPYPDSDSNRSTVATDPWLVTVTLFDEEGGPVPNTAIPGRNPVETIGAVVDNLAPSIVSLVPSDNPVIVSEGQAAAFIITTTDPSPADRLDVEFNLTVRWGDGSPDETFTQSSASGNNRVFRAAHVYNNPSAAGGFPVTFTVNDREGLRASQSIAIEVVNIPPAITDLVTTGPIPEGTPVTVAALTDNRGADVLTYTFNFNTCVLPADAADFGAAPGAANPSAVSSNTYVDNGARTVCVRVCDDDGQPNSCDFASAAIVVDNANPVITAFNPPAAILEGGSVSLTATATDLGGANDPLTFAIDCTDNGATADDPAPGSGSNRTCAYPASGLFNARVTVTDGDGGSATQTTSIRVNNRAPNAPVVTANPTTPAEGTVVNFTATSSDVGGDAFNFEYDFDNNGIFDAVSDNGASSFRFAEDGPNRTVGVRACDVEGACSTTTTTTVNVSNTAPVITSLNAPASSLVGASVTVAADARDGGSGTDALTYGFVFTAPGGVRPVTPPVGLAFQASPVVTRTLSDVGSNTVTVFVRDTSPNNVLTATSFVTINVTELSVTLIASASRPSINEGQTTDFSVEIPQGTGPFDVRFDVDGDGDFDIIAPRCANDPCVQTGVLYAQNRPGDLAFRALVEVTDIGQANAVSTAVINVEVLNVAPTVLAPDAADLTVAEGATLTADAVADDDGVNDDLTFSLEGAPEGMTIDDVDGTISWLTSFRDIGSHVVTVKVTDSDGASATDTFTAIVTIVDANNNGISDAEERFLNGGELFCANAAACTALDALDSDNDGVSDFDELAGNAPRAPVIISPDNGVEVNTGTPTLTVANATSPRGLALTYTFCVEAGAAGTAGDRCIDGVTAGETTTSVEFDDGTALVEGANVVWYAFATDSNDVDGERSATGSFTVDAVNAAPGAPDALSPAAAAAFVEGSFPTLEARAVLDPDGDAVTYTFTVATNAALTTGAFTSAARDVPFFTIDRALVPGTYHWRATASDGVLTTNGAASTFEIKAVDINEAPTAPAIVSPSNVTLEATSATLTITAGTDPDGDTLTYEFEIADNAAFANADVSGAQAGLTFAVSGLAEDTAHFWRARSFDGALYSDWSNATFVVDAVNGAPSGLALLSPTDGALLLEVPAAFTATEAIDPEGDELTYQVVVSESADFSSPLVDVAAAVVDGVVRLEAPADLTVEAGKTYFWRVTASDGTNDIVASASFSIFDEGDDVAVGGGGCGCNANEPGDSAGVIAAALGLLALRRRRRKV